MKYIYYLYILYIDKKWMIKELINIDINSIIKLDKYNY